MSDYTKSTDFAAKDSLPSGNANKIIKGTEFDTEFNNIATAVASKRDASSLEIPSQSGNSGKFLTTDGSNASWATVSGGGGGTVTSITAGTGLNGGTITSTGTISLAGTSVTPGSYSNPTITVDGYGRVTAASSGSSAGVTSFNGRTGAVSPSSSDYSSYYGSLSGTNSWSGSNTFSSLTAVTHNFYSTTSIYGSGGNSIVVSVSSSPVFSWTTTAATLAGIFAPSTDNTYTMGTSGQRWSVVYAATGTINTSDERQKEQISTIDDAVFRAWSNVNFVQFKFKDAVAEKGSAARIHFGLIAQRVKEAFEAEGLDAFAYGLLCYDEWEERTDMRGNTVSAGNAYGIRYEEALALECAYMRHRLEALENKVGV